MRRVTWVDISILFLTVILAIFYGYLLYTNWQWQNGHSDALPVEIPEEPVADEPVFEPVETETETEPETTEEPAETETETEAVAEEAQIIPETEVQTDDGYRFRENVPLPDELQKYIHDKCQEYNVPEYLLYGLIENESRFRYDLISATDDYGICQINKCNHASLSAELGISDFLDPYQGSLAGIKMLSNALTLGGGNERRALMIYHNPKCAYEDWDAGIYTSAYAETVMASAEKYK